MNNEIEKMLDFIRDYLDKFSDSQLDIRFEYKDIKLLLNYITNLQELCNKYEEEHKTTFKEWQKDIQENEYLKLSNPEMNIEHFRIINENKRKIDNLRKQNKELQQENERLKLELSGYREAILRNDELLGLQDYKSRCEKAIERLREELSYYFNNCTNQLVDDEWSDNAPLINDLLNILQNGSEENEN